MNTPPRMNADEWEYKSVYVELTTIVASLLARAAGGPETIIDNITISEVGAGTPTFTLRQTDASGAALSSDATGDLYQAKALTSKQLLELPTVARERGWIYLAAGTALFGLASANDVVNLRINYRTRR